MKTKQQIFDCFYNSLNGRGRAVDIWDSCRYFVEGHPGCAIGCQPEFVEEARKLGKEGPQLNSLTSVHCSTETNEICKKAFPGIDLDFLSELQYLHDSPASWTGDCLNECSARLFCLKHEIVSPV